MNINRYRCTEDPLWRSFFHHTPTLSDHDNKNASECMYCYSRVSWKGGYHLASIGTGHPEKIWVLQHIIREWP